MVTSYLLVASIATPIFGRGLQGLGGGVFPLSFGIIRDEFPREKVPTGIALMGAIAAIGSSIGLPLGGVLVDGPGYHWIFWVAAIMGIGATFTTWLFVPESPVRTPGRVDLCRAPGCWPSASPRRCSRSRAGTTGAGARAPRSG
jgi:MFS family permease